MTVLSITASPSCLYTQTPSCPCTLKLCVFVQHTYSVSTIRTEQGSSMFCVVRRWENNWSDFSERSLTSSHTHFLCALGLLGGKTQSTRCNASVITLSPSITSFLLVFCVFFQTFLHFCLSTASVCCSLCRQMKCDAVLLCIL